MAKLVTAILALALLLVAFFAASVEASVVAANGQPRKVTFSKYVNKTAAGIAMPPAKVGSGSSSYSYLILALQKCYDSSPFTIHGLWPSDGSSDEGPQNCGGSFDPNAISSLSSQISQDWPACPWGSYNQNDFLSHEWTKHGSCTGWSELQYFQQTLSLYTGNQWQQYCDNSQSECKVQVNLD